MKTGKDGGTVSISAETPIAAQLDADIALLLDLLHELAAIRSTAENAAETILASTDTLMTKTVLPSARKPLGAIIAACGFHDLLLHRAT